ncbi:uncharacterized protein LOC118438279 [Folsomia candida]|nr:uncharacterized protein LOC118438279 [Folsomia candida]
MAEDSANIPFILSGKYFEIISQDKDGKSVVAKCKNCPPQSKKAEFKGGLSSTTNFLNHLKRSHKELTRQYDEDVKECVKKKRCLPRKPDDKTQPQITKILPVSTQKAPPKHEKLIIDFIVKGLHAFSTVEEEGFRNLVQGLNSEVKPMSRRTLIRRIDDRYNFMRASVVSRLDGIKYLCVTTDAWSCEGKKRSYLGMTVHWITEKLTRQSVALACRRFKGSHTYDKIADMIWNILAEYKIPVEIVVKAVTDGGSNFLKAFKEFAYDPEENSTHENDGDENSSDLNSCEFLDLSTILETSKDSKDQAIKLPPHQRCASHQLNLICSSDMTKNTSRLQRSTFGKCQGIWNKSSRSTQSAEKIKEVCGISLVTPVATRWNSFYDSISCLLRFEDKLTEICKAADIPELKGTEIEFIKQYKMCVAPIAIALDRLQGKNKTFYGELLPTLLNIEKQLLKQLESKPNLCESLPTYLLDEFRKRFQMYLEFSDVHKDAILASICHPYFKLRWIPREKMNETKLFFIETLCSETPTNTIVNTEIPPKDGLPTRIQDARKENAIDDNFFQFEEFDGPSEEEKSHETKIKEECEAYFRSPSDKIEMLHNFPTIKMAFMKYNTPLPSSAPDERLFNYAKMVMCPQRRGMTDENFEKATLLKVNIY